MQMIELYSSLSGDYQRAFQVFLDHTDQKATARAWLERLVAGLPSRRVFVDAGAGNGKVTAWFTDAFEHAIAIEPNPHLRADLAQHCPSVEVLPDTILEASPSRPGDLVLCSHVLYYIDGEAWMAHVERMASWLAANGVLVVAIQNQDTDCMRMLDHFYGWRFDLHALVTRLRAEHGQELAVTLETVPAHVTTQDFERAYVVAEFMMNLPPSAYPVPRRDLEAYVQQTFRRDDGYRFSCHQDFLQIRRRLAGAHGLIS